MPTPIVFFDIAGPTDTHLAEFYSTVFGWKPGENGELSTNIASPSVSPYELKGTLRDDPAEKVFYLGVEDITATLAEVVSAGGAIDQPRFEVPNTVILGLFKDPAGNRMGLVEMEKGKVKIPTE